MVAPPAHCYRAEAGQVGCQPLDVEQVAAPGPQGLDQGYQGHLGRVPLVVEHRLAGEEPSDGHPVQASCDLAGRRTHR